MKANWIGGLREMCIYEDASRASGLEELGLVALKSGFNIL